MEPTRIVTRTLSKPLGLLSPVANPTLELKNVASFIRRISVSDLAGSQFSDPPCAGRWIDPEQARNLGLVGGD